MRPYSSTLAMLLAAALCCEGKWCLADVLTRVANRLVASQLPQGHWGEEGFVGECTIGLCGAYEVTGTPTYKTAAEKAGEVILLSAGYDSETGSFLLPLYAAESYALACLSAIEDDRTGNLWRSALENFFDQVRALSGSTRNFIDDFVADYGPAQFGTAIYDVARFAAAAAYVGDTDVGVWRGALIDLLGDLDDGDDRPVTALGAALAALVATGGLDDTVLDGSSTTLSGKRLSELPHFVASLSLDTFEGSFPWNFNGTYPGFLEATCFPALALRAVGGYDSFVAAAAARIQGGVDPDGRCFHEIGQPTSGSTSYYAGETLEVLAAAYDLLCCEAADADRSNQCVAPVDLVYVYRAVNSFESVAPERWRQWDETIPADGALRQRILDHKTCYDIDGDRDVDQLDIVYLYRALRNFEAVAPPQWRDSDPTIPFDDQLRDAAQSLCRCVPDPGWPTKKGTAPVAAYVLVAQGPEESTAKLSVRNSEPLTFFECELQCGAGVASTLTARFLHRAEAASGQSFIEARQQTVRLWLWNPTGSVVLQPGSGVIAEISFQARSEPLSGGAVTLTKVQAMRGTQVLRVRAGTALRFVRGDANQDARINIADAIGTLRYLFGGEALLCLDAADASGDGTLSIADPVRLLLYLFSSGSVLPPPFPECGFGPQLGCESSVCPQ